MSTDMTFKTLRVFGYKPDSADVFRGHVRARFSSDCFIFTCPNSMTGIDSLIAEAAKRLAKDVEYGEATYQLVVCLDGSTFLPEGNGDIYDRAFEEADDDYEVYLQQEAYAYAIVNRIKESATKIKEEHQAALAAEEHKKAKQQEQQAREKRRKEYEALKQEFDT